MNQYGNSSQPQRGPAQQPPPSQSNPAGGSYFVDQKKGEINELKQVCVRSNTVYSPAVVGVAGRNKDDISGCSSRDSILPRYMGLSVSVCCCVELQLQQCKHHGSTGDTTRSRK